MTKRILKYLAFAALTSGCVLNAYAVGPGLYLGLQLGPATNGANEQLARTQFPPPTFVVAKPKSSQFGTRIFLGYQPSKFFGFEMGLFMDSKIKYDTGNIQTCSGATARVKDIEFLGKGILPFSTSWGDFDVYGKAGFAFVYVESAGCFNGPTCKNEYVSNWKPAIAFGGSYNITQSWVADLSLNELLIGGVVKSTQFFALGFAYHFVDRYCGQFLCDD